MLMAAGPLPLDDRAFKSAALHADTLKKRYTMSGSLIPSSLLQNPSQAVFKLSDKTDYCKYPPVSDPLPLDLPAETRVPVLLLDNLEFLGSTWRTTAVDPDDVAVKDDWAAYVSTLLSAAVAETCKINAQLRVAFSVTQTEFAHHFLFHKLAQVFPIADSPIEAANRVGASGVPRRTGRVWRRPGGICKAASGASATSAALSSGRSAFKSGDPIADNNGKMRRESAKCAPD